MLYRSWLVYLTSHIPCSSHHALQTLRQVYRRQGSHEATTNINTKFDHHRRDLTTMYMSTTIPRFPCPRSIRGLDAFFDVHKLASILCYKSRCVHCHIVLALRQVFGIGQRTKKNSNIVRYCLSLNTSILLQALGPTLKETQSRNTTTVFTSTCTLQACSSLRCSP